MMENTHLQCKKQDPPTTKRYEVSPNVMTVIRLAESLPKEEYHELICELAKRSPCSFEEKRAFKNLIVESFNRETKKRSIQISSKELENVTGQQGIVDSSASPALASASTSTISSVGHMPPFICRGDLIEKADVLFFDTEKVVEATSHHQVSGDLAIVDVRGNLVFWTYIKRKDVCLYNTKLTGLSSDKLKTGLELNMVKDILNCLLKGKPVYGASSKNDIISLGFKLDEVSFQINDIQDFFRDKLNQPISLARLSEHFLGENLQESKHSSVVDARLTAICYRRMEKMRSEGMIRFSCADFDSIERDPKKKRNQGWENKCNCGVGFLGKRKGKKAEFGIPTRFNIGNYDV